jgi:hypothetical protein
MERLKYRRVGEWQAADRELERTGRRNQPGEVRKVPALGETRNPRREYGSQ